MTTNVIKPCVKVIIKNAAQQLFMDACAEAIGLSYGDGPYSKQSMIKNHWEYHKEILNLLELPVLPKHRKWEVNQLETRGESDQGSYYPKGSFYRLGLIMGGNLGEEDKSFFYRSCTYHFDKDMNYISIQFHWNNEDVLWDANKPVLISLFESSK